MVEKPQPAARRPKPGDARSSSGPSHTGLLVNVIRTLQSSSVEQREVERDRLERGYAESGKLIDDLVQEHEYNVNASLESFRNVSQRITSCRERIENIRNGLQSCKTLLQNRRDDLKSLWTENAQQRHVTVFLQQIEELDKVKGEVENAISEAKYVEAINWLKNADSLLKGPLGTISGLSQIQAQCSSLQKCLLDKITDEICAQLITRPFQEQIMDALKKMDTNTVADSELGQRLLQRDSSSSSDGQSSQMETASSIVASLEALRGAEAIDAVLSRLDERCERALSRSLGDSCSLVRLMLGNAVGDSSQMGHLIQLILAQTRSAALAHAQLAIEISQTDSRASAVLLRTFWKRLQEGVERLLATHFGVEDDEDNGTVGGTVASDRPVLFRFHYSAGAAALHFAQQASQNQPLVCSVSPWNVEAVFGVLSRLCDEIESKADDEKPCALRRYAENFVQNRFLDCVRLDLEKKAETALHVADVWTALAQSNALPLAQHTLKQRLLRSSIAVFELCEQVARLTTSIEPFADRFAALWLLIITEYTTCAHSMYEQITRSIRTAPDGETVIERRKISAAWAIDEDISRLLKTLPNWLEVKRVDCDPNTPSALSPPSESDAEVRQRNERESDILIGNLGTQKQIQQQELITDTEQIRALASMHESLEWLSASVRKLVMELPKRIRNRLEQCIVELRSDASSEVVRQSVWMAVGSRLDELSAMSDTCLLMLHLEVRVHIFWHLLPLFRMKSVALHEDTDPEVTAMGRDLAQLHSLLSQYLAPQKLRYLFDGLGHLSAAIFIHSSQQLPKLNEAGKKRICRNVFSVQQQLSRLTGRRETELERARTFFELLRHSPDELLGQIPNTGKLFSPVEYSHLLSLAVRSHPVLSSQPGALEMRINQLRKLMTNMQLTNMEDGENKKHKTKL